MNNFLVKRNAVLIGETSVQFPYDILEIKPVETQLLVLLKIPPHSKEIDNIYAVGWDGVIRWRIQNRSKFESRHSQTPYVGMIVVNGRLKVFDFCGIRYWVNLENGHIIERDSDGRYW